MSKCVLITPLLHGKYNDEFWKIACYIVRFCLDPNWSLIYFSVIKTFCSASDFLTEICKKEHTVQFDSL